MLEIHDIPSSWATSYLIETDEALFLVDAGFVRHDAAVLKRIEDLGRSPEELRFALVTHVHPDHFGGLAALRGVADFEIGCHPLHLGALQEGRGMHSPGLTWWARPYMAVARLAFRFLTFTGVPSSRAVARGESLHHLGLPGRVHYTPGHSEGCVSLVLDDGTALTGDLVQGPRRPGALPEFPAMGLDTRLILSSWRSLLDLGVRRILPAHGAPHDAQQLRLALAALER